MSKIYFFRHAQASFGTDNYDQLSPKGIEQSHLLGQYLSKEAFQFDRVFVGPLQRQKHTADIVKTEYQQQQKSFPNIQTLEDLREHQGTAAMKLAWPQLMESVPAIQAWYEEMKQNPKLKQRNTLLSFRYFMQEWAEGHILLPQLQTWATFRQQSRQALATILEVTQKGETVAVFTSGGVVASIVGESLSLSQEHKIADLNFSIRNSSFTSFFYAQDQFNLLSLNEIPHLPKSLITFV